jgi:ABC-type phosphate/phosphonate transport system substrate-binding protein
MKARILVAVLLQLVLLQAVFAVESDDATPKRIRIGVDIRMGFQSCIDYWTPVTAHLTKAIPGYRFVIVPLASQQDLIRTLDKGGVDFLALDPAMELMAEDRCGVTPLATMTEASPNDARRPSPDAASSGAVIRRADRSKIQNLRDLRGLRLSAVKPWSLTGWIAQWGLLVRNGVDPRRDLKQVAFEGTHGQVVQRVLDGSADAGAVDADLLSLMMQNRQIAPNSLYVVNREGQAVPLAPGKPVASTNSYPGRMFSKAAGVSDELAKQVTDALLKAPLDTKLDGMPCRIAWSAPCNSSKVRRLLQNLMGIEYAESDGFPLPPRRPAWLYPVQVFAVALGVVFLVGMMLHRHYRRRDQLLAEQLQDTRKELIEVRADLQRINAILALAGCGIDVVDDDNQIIYADTGLQQRFGDWHGRKCHDYFCDSDVPCPECQRPFPMNELCRTSLDVDCSEWKPRPASSVEPCTIEGETTRMIAVPFRDEAGRWLSARIHFPLTAFAKKEMQEA